MLRIFVRKMSRSGGVLNKLVQHKRATNGKLVSIFVITPKSLVNFCEFLE